MATNAQTGVPARLFHILVGNVGVSISTITVVAFLLRLRAFGGSTQTSLLVIQHASVGPFLLGTLHTLVGAIFPLTCLGVAYLRVKCSWRAAGVTAVLTCIFGALMIPALQLLLTLIAMGAALVLPADRLRGARDLPTLVVSLAVAGLFALLFVPPSLPAEYIAYSDVTDAMDETVQSGAYGLYVIKADDGGYLLGIDVNDGLIRIIPLDKIDARTSCSPTRSHWLVRPFGRIANESRPC